MKNEIFRLGIILMAFTAIAAFALAGTSLITTPLIAEQRELIKAATQQEVLPSAVSFDVFENELIGSSEYADVVAVATGMDELGNPAGSVITVAPRGYGGPINIMVGITLDGAVSGLKIVSHSETPGLGANASSPGFSGQFIGKSSAETLTVVKGVARGKTEISALTAATISSRAVTTGVNQALRLFTALQAK